MEFWREMNKINKYGNVRLRWPGYADLGQDGPARAQGRPWAPSASRCGLRGRLRALPIPQAGVRALAGSLFGA